MDGAEPNPDSQIWNFFLIRHRPRLIDPVDSGQEISPASGAQTEKHQTQMLGEIAKLVGTNPKGTGWLDPAAYDRTVKILLSGKSAPVITKAPEGAWTHDVFDKAMAMQ